MGFKACGVVCTNQIESDAGFLRRGENRSTRRKTSQSRVENQQTQPTCDAESGNRTRATEPGSLRNWANWMLTWPNKAITSTEWVIKLEFAEPEAFCSKKWLVCSNFTHYLLHMWKVEMKLGPYFEVDLRAFDNTTIFWPLYLSSKLFNYFEDSFFPQRFFALSASCCKILSPVASSSSKPWAMSWKILASGAGVSRAWPIRWSVADDWSVTVLDLRHR